MSEKADFGWAVVMVGELVNLSQKTLATALEVKPKTVTNWKKGLHFPNRHAMALLPTVLGFPLEKIRAVAAYRANLRHELKTSIHQAGEVRELPPPASDDDDRHREIGRVFEHLFNLLPSKR